MAIDKIFGRTGPNIVAESGDYSTALITNKSTISGVTAKAAMDALVSRADNIVDPAPNVGMGGDLGGTAAVPKVLQIMGRAIADIAPNDGDRLFWNDSNGNWEPRAPAGGTAKTAALLPTGWKNAVIQAGLRSQLAIGMQYSTWDYEYHPAVITTWEAERVRGWYLYGNGGSGIPDLVPGYVAKHTLAGPYQATRFAAGAALQFLGPMTVLMRVLRTPVPTTNPPYFEIMNCGQDNAQEDYESMNRLWGLQGATWDGAPGATLRYSAYRGFPSVRIEFTSTAIPAFSGGWEVVSLRRDATGVVRLGKNKVYESSGPLPLPTGGGENDVRIGLFGGSVGLAYADFNAFDTALSDADVDEATDIMLGL